ncbi:acetyl-CoA acetyltransferase, cytosolic 1-like protein, partial [Tanacetum coccineum]
DFLGSLSSLSATTLGSLAIHSALQRASVPPHLVQEIFFGNVLSANLGQAPARQAALGAGIPHSVVCTTINKVCSSGMKSVRCCVISLRLGHESVVDGMVKDGLWDVYNDFGMGVCGELCADTYGITREQQDEYAVRSFNRGIAAQKSGALNGRWFRLKFLPEKERPLLFDGAAALVLVSGEKALELGLKVIARIRGSADAAQAPEWFTTAPALAIPKAISNAGLKASEIDYYEINEAFSEQDFMLIVGAVSLGTAHRLVAECPVSARKTDVLRQNNGRLGVAGICNGGGGSSALVLELMPSAKKLRNRVVNHLCRVRKVTVQAKCKRAVRKVISRVEPVKNKATTRSITLPKQSDNFPIKNKYHKELDEKFVGRSTILLSFPHNSRRSRARFRYRIQSNSSEILEADDTFGKREMPERRQCERKAT